jgi:hypothetical protein
MRGVSFILGTKNSKPIRGLTSRLIIVSRRLLRTRSGSSSVRLSSTRTKPGGSPRGEMSTPTVIHESLVLFFHRDG